LAAKVHAFFIFTSPVRWSSELRGEFFSILMASQLPNYLLAHRKRSALSQDDVAYLLGKRGGEKVSRYERFSREPKLETILAYEAIFQKPASQLFAGQYRKIERRVAERAKVLAHKTKRQKPSRMMERKLQALSAIIQSFSR
jgi:transcriptional regulator with XRE-family HTH domain